MVKIRTRKATRFSPGTTAGWLMTIAGLLWALDMNRVIPGLLNDLALAIGLGTVSEDILIATMGVPIMILAFMALRIGTRYNRELQGLRDSEANLDGPNVLFLRPYFTDVRLALLNPFYSAAAFGMSFDSYVISPQEFVGRVLEPYINVREVGGSPSTIGNARIHVADEEWKTAVQHAIQAASAIVVLPLLEEDAKTGAVRGEATLWELQYLVDSGWMSRTIVLMPQVHWRRRKKTHEAWERTHMRVTGFGLSLPPYEKHGGVFTFAFIDGVWQPEWLFAPPAPDRKKLAAGLVEAVQWMSERFAFPLLNR